VDRVVVPFRGRLMEGVVVADPDRLLTTAEVAAALGIQPATWRKMVSVGSAPRADDPGVGPVNRRTPRWRVSTVRAFRLGRKGKGFRSDLVKE
jgi:hypothetical protein